MIDNDMVKHMMRQAQMPRVTAFMYDEASTDALSDSINKNCNCFLSHEPWEPLLLFYYSHGQSI